MVRSTHAQIAPPMLTSARRTTQPNPALDAAMNGHAFVGAPLKRREDPRFLTGTSCFTDDLAPAGVLHAGVVLSSHAHARLRMIDAAAARTALGVRLVATAADIAG